MKNSLEGIAWEWMDEIHGENNWGGGGCWRVVKGGEGEGAFICMHIFHFRRG